MSNKGIKIFNFIRNKSTEAFTKVVPSATENNILEIKNILFNDAYQPMLNEFVNGLINRIALTIVRNQSYNNPLSIFKKGSVPLGTDIQDIFTNPAEAEQYELSNTAMAKLLTITDPDTHVAYYRRNRQDLYTKTITRENLMGAFVSWDEFEKYIGSITQSLYSGNYIDEFEYTKDLIDGAYANGKVIVQVVADPSLSEANAKAFVKQARKIYKKITFPSTEYNAYSKFSGARGKVKTWTNEDRIVLIVNSDAMADVDVDVLAQAFNIDSAKLLGRIYEVDGFKNDNIIGVLCDESWLQIYDNLFRFDEFYNARVMAWNEYLHAWGTYAICPFANAVVLAKANPTELTSITAPVNDVELDVGESTEVTFTLNPANADTIINYESSNPLIFTVTKVANNKVKVDALTEGTGKITATSTNGKTAEANVVIPTGE